MKFVHSFDTFLKDEVNLNQTRIDQANNAFETLTSFLKNADETKDLFVSTSKQGSLRQRTIIKPRKDATEFDVDLLLECNAVEGWSPSQYLDAVHDAFANSDRYAELVDTRGKHRCVTIDYAGDFHVDVVPSIEDEDGQCWIMNREKDELEVTDGDGYARWFKEKSDLVGGSTLVRTVRLLKYLRDEQEWGVKSVLLTTMIGLAVNDGDSAADYPEVPTALKVLIGRLDDELQPVDDVPEVANPVLPDELFTRHWDSGVFEAFKAALHDSRSQIDDAYDDDDSESSAEKWQKLFGDQFSILDEDLEGGRTLASALPVLGSTAHAQPVTAIPVSAEDLQYTVRLDAWVYGNTGKIRFRGINSGARVLSGRSIRFKARTNAPEPFEVRWQVVNTGQHAASENALRGSFFTGRDLSNKATNKLVNWERTQYTGRHWIECFIVKNRVCVGRSGRFYVNIKNPNV